MINETLLNAYKNAKYIVFIENLACRIKVGEHCPKIDLILAELDCTNAYFVTPENPFSNALSDQENKLRHQRFKQELRKSNYPVFEGYGTSETETWSKEQSYLIVCDDETQMHKLAAKYGQNGLLKIIYQSPTLLLVLDPLSYTQAKLI